MPAEGGPRAAHDLARRQLPQRARLHARRPHRVHAPPQGSRSSATSARMRSGADDPLPEMLPLGQVDHLVFGPRIGSLQAMLIGRNTRDPAWWKRYRGGTAGYLWIDASGDGQFRRMSELQGNITSPMWIGSRVYFLSDFQGIGNLYSCLPDGKDLRRHTDHAEYYARHAHDRRPAHRLPVRRGPVAVRSGHRPGEPPRRSACPRIARRRRASSCRRPTTSRACTCTRRATASRSRRAASCSRARSGKARCASTATPRSAASATGSGSPTASVGGGQRRLGRGTRGGRTPTAPSARSTGTSGA